MTSSIQSDGALGESVVDEVRAIREAIDREVDHDVVQLAIRVRKAGEAVCRELGMKMAELPVSPITRPHAARS